MICNGKDFGYTPITLYYNASVREQPTMNVSSCRAQWSSGVSKQYPEKLTVFANSGTNISLERPDVPGYSQDAEFALKVQEMRASQQQVVAQQRQATAQQMQAKAAQEQARAAQQQADAIQRQNMLNCRPGIQRCF
ncbi:hypothetical protein JCM19233_1927 [Vibrio astriarenae]|nr:hypothetical protein JCM19233_1927 [Vibrio sp. C7]